MEKLGKTTKAYNNGAYPEHKDAYNWQSSELNRITEILLKYKKDLQELIEE